VHNYAIANISRPELTSEKRASVCVLIELNLAGITDKKRICYCLRWRATTLALLRHRLQGTECVVLRRAVLYMKGRRVP
jgi:hypothetical protein